ncbi:MAG: phosphoserine phosphatase SerB [Pseudomonadota bacterium]
MTSILTLIAGIGAGIADDVVAPAIAALGEAGAQVGAPLWLAPGTACDIPFEGIEPATAERAVRGRLDGAPVDLAAQRARGRRKKLLVADMESTIITRELLDELGAMIGLADRIRPITARAMRGEIDFAGALRERVALLRGQPATILDRVAERIELMPGARRLVQTMRAQGAHAALVSGGFDCFTALAAKAAGFDEHHANRLLIADGRLVGRVVEPILDRTGKQAVLKELAAARGLALEDAAAVGDGANDIPMLQAAGLGVAFRGKPAVAAAARFRLDHADLTGLLYLQGYRPEEFRE